jgi:undecaprenyl-diphosphatase
MSKKYFINQWDEVVRDFTALGDPIILLILLLLFIGIGESIGIILLLWLLIEAIGIAIKLIFFKDRPKKMKKNNLLEKLDAGTFPSMHSSRSAFLYLVLFTLVANPLKYLFIFMLIMVGITRVLLKKHYIKDVIAGYILGIAVFFLWLFIR